eukprot:TRINITY_DN36909_c0_g1_i1.p1 TRINITY_DN36909_c0_g1~~TRINITY_DN36909_c0_g1_i1.p1  ORF type:complete len:116 (-),score=12.19 TRINITY_DN36909_c0_g1_i1:19-366(-)
MAYKATVVAALLQSMETFALSHSATDKLEAQQVRLGIRVLGVYGFIFTEGKISARISAMQVREKLRWHTVASTLRCRRLRWLRKVAKQELLSKHPSFQLASLFGKFDWEASFSIY